MASVIIGPKGFGGLIPKISSPKNLPPNAAQRAQDVDLSSGALVPISVDPPFTVMHDENGILKAGIAREDIALIDVPNKPTTTRLKMCVPGSGAGWFDFVRHFVYVTWIESDGTFNSLEVTLASSVANPHIEYTKDGFIARCKFGVAAFTATLDVAYSVWGPFYQFDFDEDFLYNGGPDSEGAGTYPEDEDMSHSASTVPQFSIPLTYPVSMAEYPGVNTGERFTYGFLELVDYDIPSIEHQVALNSADFDSGITEVEYTILDIYKAEFRFSCNYIRNSSVSMYYMHQWEHPAKVASGTVYSANGTTVVLENISGITSRIPQTGNLANPLTFVKYPYTGFLYDATNDRYNFTCTTDIPDGTRIDAHDDTAEGMDGPPSEVTEMVVVDPGEIIKLTIEANTFMLKQRVLRSSLGEKGSYNIVDDDISASAVSFYDNFMMPIGDTYESNDSFPHDDIAGLYTSEDALEDFLIGSVVHPAAWAAGYWKNELRPSRPFKHWDYPEEFAVPFQTDIRAIALTGNTILVFTEPPSDTVDGKVFAVSGTNPEFLAYYELSDSSPLLNVVGLAKVGGNIVWPSRDGLMVSGGGDIQNITQQQYTREEWAGVYPQYMSCYVADKTVYALVQNGVNYRFDMKESGSSLVTTFTEFSGKDLIWQSKDFEMPRPVSFSCVRIEADDYPVAVEFWGDGEMQHMEIIHDGEVKKLPDMRMSDVWSFVIKSNNKVTEFGVATNVRELSGYAG